VQTDVTQDVFEVVLARPVVVDGGEHPGLVHLWWSAPEQGDRLVQVYIDGELIDMSQDSSQREMWLMCDRSVPHRIELLAVPMTELNILRLLHLEQLRSWDPPVNSEISLALVRDEQLPVDTRVSIEEAKLLIDEGAMWPAEEHRGGFGALFGVGGFGLDAATGPGLGVGELGMGPLGTDGAAWRWRRNDLAVGIHELDVITTDEQGLAVAQELALSPAVVDALPTQASTFSMDADFTLRWSS